MKGFNSTSSQVFSQKPDKLWDAISKENNLNDPKNKRNILVDSSLKKILNFDGIPNNQITYFNLQKALKHNFLSGSPVVSA